MKKLLLVAVSVGVFLLVTITVAIIVLTPKTQIQAPAITSSNPFSEPVQSYQEILPPQPAIIGVQEPNFSLSNELTFDDIDSINGDRLTIKIPVPSAAAVPDTNAQTISETVSVITVPESAALNPVQNVTAVKPAETKPAAARTVTAVRTPTPALAKTINDFWVQTGAFSAQVRAEDAKELLAAKGITSIIENREINGRIWYRVRLGPYTSEREANHWLEIVKLIDGFNDSQIRQSVRQN
ncbi:MAG: SPOR domain-containing protein [Treponema sp.]|nr:SPOR domain-containing protein [Treponema sp.]